jgi:16S rRNA (guanine966-N2)-methyltransferase
MRIIAGQRRGHKIDGPKPSAGTWPTSDFVRESFFNILGELVVGRLVVDLFAGTGALGLEALSRGAERAIFVESNRANVGLIFRNIATLRYENRAIARLVECMPAGSAVALEAGRVLDATILGEMETWDIRRYGNKRIAIKVVAGVEAGAGPGASGPPETSRSGEDRVEPEDDRND